jgi:hypothetical protein
MFEYYQNNVLCVQANWLINEGILAEGNYESLVRRNQLKRIQKGGNGRKALIEFNTMRADIKNKVIEIAGDPYVKVSTISFTDYIEQDQKAYEFFENYTLDSGEALPEKNKKEYLANANVLNAINNIYQNKAMQRKALAGSKLNVWQKITEVVSELPRHTYPHSLPSNSRRLQDKLKQYLNDGYTCLIHKNFCSKNAEKITEESGRWIFARWCDRVKRCPSFSQLLFEYNEEAQLRGWKELKTEQSIINYLSPLEYLWYGYRYGELKAKEKFTYHHKTALPSMRDSLWYSDGTKLNMYYQENGKMKTINVYEVMDAYSEVFLGYHISETENYEAQYFAYKMAMKTAGTRPYQISFDNQGGHKRLESGNFLNKISHLAIKTQPYNGKSKTIESAFGRFQSQILAQHWYFTGQNITATKVSSHANMEMILANTANLPTLQEVKAIYAKCREQWNSGIHPKTGISRIDMYYNSINEEAPQVSPLQMVDFFWIEREKQVTCTSGGITIKEKNTQYDYMVYNHDRTPDLVWLNQNVDKKFTIKFDPDDMSLIMLYEKTPLGLRLVKEAETKVIVHRGKQEQEDFEAGYFKTVNDKLKEIRISNRDEVETILEQEGRRAVDYGLNEPALKGIESSRAKKEKLDIGSYQKKVSEAVLSEDNNDINIYDIM